MNTGKENPSPDISIFTLHYVFKDKVLSLSQKQSMNFSFSKSIYIHNAISIIFNGINKIYKSSVSISYIVIYNRFFSTLTYEWLVRLHITWLYYIRKWYTDLLLVTPDNFWLIWQSQNIRVNHFSFRFIVSFIKHTNSDWLDYNRSKLHNEH